MRSTFSSRGMFCGIQEHRTVLLQPVGLCLVPCGWEKGYRTWGMDMTTGHSPYEAGLGFAVREIMWRRPPSSNTPNKRLLGHIDWPFHAIGQGTRVPGRPDHWVRDVFCIWLLDWQYRVRVVACCSGRGGIPLDSNTLGVVSRPPCLQSHCLIPN